MQHPLVQAHVQEPTARPRLLAIDESTEIHRLLKSNLRSERVEIHSATTAEQGLRSARTLQPDVILLSVELPDMHGFNVLESLKTDGGTHDIPVIFLSSSADTRTIVHGLDMGAIDFVGKPFDIGELKARVRSAIRIRLLIKMLAQRAQIDGLTGLWNRAHFDQRLQEEVAAALRHQAPLSLILIDLDRFKQINDTRGHPFGDQVLEEVGRMLARGRAGDVACRYGGEEFAIISPRTSAEDAMYLAERLREEMRDLRWEGAPELKVTASMGVADLTFVQAEFVGGEDAASAGAAAGVPGNVGASASVHLGGAMAKSLIEVADTALYRAKSLGRDQVVLAERQNDRTRAIA